MWGGGGGGGGGGEDVVESEKVSWSGWYERGFCMYITACAEPKHKS